MCQFSDPQSQSSLLHISPGREVYCCCARKLLLRKETAAAAALSSPSLSQELVHEELLKIAEAAAPPDLGRFPALQRQLAAAVLGYIQVGTMVLCIHVCVRKTPAHLHTCTHTDRPAHAHTCFVTLPPIIPPPRALVCHRLVRSQQR
jgi:hypothetical protein